MTIPLSSSVQLYPHDPQELITLLEQCRPRSLPVLSTIHENLSTTSSNGVVYTTSKSPPTEGTGTWAVIVQIRDPTNIHLRLYVSSDLSVRGEEEDDRSFAEGLGDAIVNIWGKEVILGAVESGWFEGLRNKLDADDNGEYTVFLAPPTSTLEEEVVKVNELGLEFDLAQPGDIDLIRRTCDVPRPAEYYLARSAETTVLRPIKGGEAVCWVIHHADGSLGALYTVPNWRRKGLAKYVVQRRIRDHIRTRDRSADVDVASATATVQEGEGKDFCYVAKGNTASEGLWRKLGWADGPAVKWIVNRELDRKRGKVVLNRDFNELA